MSVTALLAGGMDAGGTRRRSRDVRLSNDNLLSLDSSSPTDAAAIRQTRRKSREALAAVPLAADTVEDTRDLLRFLVRAAALRRR